MRPATDDPCALSPREQLRELAVMLTNAIPVRRLAGHGCRCNTPHRPRGDNVVGRRIVGPRGAVEDPGPGTLSLTTRTAGVRFSTGLPVDGPANRRPAPPSSVPVGTGGGLYRTLDMPRTQVSCPGPKPHANAGPPNIEHLLNHGDDPDVVDFVRRELARYAGTAQADKAVLAAGSNWLDSPTAGRTLPLIAALQRCSERLARPDTDEADRLRALIVHGAENLPAVADMVDVGRVAQRAGLEHVPREDLIRWLRVLHTEASDLFTTFDPGIDFTGIGRRLRYTTNVEGLTLARERIAALSEADRLTCTRRVRALGVPLSACVVDFGKLYPDPDDRRVILAALKAVGDAHPGDLPAVEYRRMFIPCLPLATASHVPWLYTGDGSPEAALGAWYARLCFELIEHRAERWAASGDAPREALAAVADWLADPTPGRRLLAIRVVLAGDTATNAAGGHTAGSPDGGGETQNPVDRTPCPKRPPENAFKAWRLRDLKGPRTQQEIAEKMSDELGRTVSQGEISRWLSQVEKYLKAGNILPDLPAPMGKPQSIDPAVLDMGARVDHRAPRPSERRRNDSHAE